jgi:hypothetical protein
MSFDTDHTEKLKQFLQANQPMVPPPSPALERQLLQRIHELPPPRVALPRFSWPWLTGGLLLLGLLVGGGINSWRQTQIAQEPNMEELEAFLQETWSEEIYPENTDWQNATVQESSPTQEWWLLTDSPQE